MKSIEQFGTVVLFTLLLSASAAADAPTQVMLHGKPLTLIGQPLRLGGALPALSLPDTGLRPVSLQSFKGKVTIISVVPSIDTAVCEKQTHILSEENAGLDRTANLITISRDLPFAQRRFAKEANIHNVRFLSDYREADFGRGAGLLIEENRLLSRAVLVLDSQGIIRHLEVVPDLGQLPEMEKAFAVARSLP